jgi:neutral ceramidase
MSRAASLRRRWSRRGALLSLSGALAGGFVLVIGPWPAARGPALEQAGARQALEQAAELGRGLRLDRAAEAPLRAGWAAEPFELGPWPLAGYGARRGAASTGQREPLYARCVLLEAGDTSALLVFTDLLLVYPGLVAQVEERLAEAFGARQPPWPVHFTATHTHCGPGGWGRNPLEQSVTGSRHPEVTEKLAAAITRAAVAAAGGMEEVAWGWLELAAPGRLRNRTIKGGPVDPRLEALVLRRERDGLRAVLAVFGAHATCLPAGMLEFAADYPGELTRALAADDRVDFAAFAAGVVGSHSPVGEGREAALAEDLGRSLAEQLLAALDQTPPRRGARLRAAVSRMTAPGLQMRLNGSLQLAGPAVRWLHPGVTRVSAVALDEHLWIGLPFELSGMLSPPLRSHARERGWKLTLTCFSGDYLGYVLPDELHSDLGLYEARMNFLGPGGGSFVSRLVETVVEAAGDERGGANQAE